MRVRILDLIDKDFDPYSFNSFDLISLIEEEIDATLEIKNLNEYWYKHNRLCKLLEQIKEYEKEEYRLKEKIQEKIQKEIKEIFSVKFPT